jgi:hypothetical protein
MPVEGRISNGVNGDACTQNTRSRGTIHGDDSRGGLEAGGSQLARPSPSDPASSNSLAARSDATKCSDSRIRHVHHRLLDKLILLISQPPHHWVTGFSLEGSKCYGHVASQHRDLVTRWEALKKAGAGALYFRASPAPHCRKRQGQYLLSQRRRPFTHPTGFTHGMGAKLGGFLFAQSRLANSDLLRLWRFDALMRHWQL